MSDRRRPRIIRLVIRNRITGRRFGICRTRSVSYNDGMKDGPIIPPHLLGERIDYVTHMCPECGHPPRAFCPTCHGAGVVDESQLAVWQTRADAEAA